MIKTLLDQIKDIEKYQLAKTTELDAKIKSMSDENERLTQLVSKLEERNKKLVSKVHFLEERPPPID